MKEGGKAVRQASGRFGGRVSIGNPVVTYTLIGLNVLVYLVELVYPKAIDYGALAGKLYDPAMNFSFGIAYGDWYRFLTSAFLHEPLNGGYGILHIAFNMWALYVVGPVLEQTLGRLRFVAVYLLSALGGGVMLYLIAPFIPAYGASGAIFGLFGAWFVVAKRLGLDPRQVIVLIVLNLVIGFAIPNVAWQAHVGGLITGVALTAAYVYAPRQNRSGVQLGATVAMLALLIAGVLIKDQLLVHTITIRF